MLIQQNLAGTPQFPQYEVWGLDILSCTAFSIIVCAPVGLLIIGLAGPRLLPKVPLAWDAKFCLSLCMQVSSAVHAVMHIQTSYIRRATMDMLMSSDMHPCDPDVLVKGHQRHETSTITWGLWDVARLSRFSLL